MPDGPHWRALQHVRRAMTNPYRTSANTSWTTIASWTAPGRRPLSRARRLWPTGRRWLQPPFELIRRPPSLPLVLPSGGATEAERGGSVMKPDKLHIDAVPLGSLITVQAAADCMSGRWTIYQTDLDNQVASVLVGRCRRIVRKSFEDYLATHRGVRVMAERKDGNGRQMAGWGLPARRPLGGPDRSVDLPDETDQRLRRHSAGDVERVTRMLDQQRRGIPVVTTTMTAGLHELLAQAHWRAQHPPEPPTLKAGAAHIMPCIGSRKLKSLQPAPATVPV